jgi:hypothetical protein
VITCESCMRHDFKMQANDMGCASCELAQNHPVHD